MQLCMLGGLPYAGSCRVFFCALGMLPVPQC